MIWKFRNILMMLPINYEAAETHRYTLHVLVTGTYIWHWGYLLPLTFGSTAITAVKRAHAGAELAALMVHCVVFAMASNNRPAPSAPTTCFFGCCNMC